MKIAQRTRAEEEPHQRGEDVRWDGMVCDATNPTGSLYAEEKEAANAPEEARGGNRLNASLPFFPVQESYPAEKGSHRSCIVAEDEPPQKLRKREEEEDQGGGMKWEDMNQEPPIGGEGRAKEGNLTRMKDGAAQQERFPFLSLLQEESMEEEEGRKGRKEVNGEGDAGERRSVWDSYRHLPAPSPPPLSPTMTTTSSTGAKRFRVRSGENEGANTNDGRGVGPEPEIENEEEGTDWWDCFGLDRICPPTQMVTAQVDEAPKTSSVQDPKKRDVVCCPIATPT